MFDSCGLHESEIQVQGFSSLLKPQFTKTEKYIL